MAGLTSIKRKGFRGGGMDMSTVSAADIGIGTDTSKRDYSPQEKKEQRETKQLNERLERNRQEREKQKVLDEIYVTPFARNKKLNKFQLYNNLYQKKQNQKLAQKRAFELAKRLEKYVHGDMDMDYDFTQDIYGNKISKGLENLISNKGTSIESTRKNLYTVNPSVNFSLAQALLSKTRPDTQVTLKNTKQAMRDYNMLAVDPNISKEKLDAIANRGKTPDQINPPDTGGNNQSYLLPIDYNTGAATVEAVEPYTNDFEYRFGTGQNVGADVLRGYVANGGRITRAGGGIMNAVPRQGYFLGKIVKGVGKAVGSVAKAAGKVLSSDFGKMALAGAAFYYGGGGGNPFTAAGRAKFSAPSFFSKSNPLLFSAGTGENLGKQVFNPLKFAGLITAGGALAGPAKVDQMPGEDGARGGRLIDPLTGQEGTPSSMRANIENAKIEAGGDPVKLAALNQKYNNMLFSILPYENYGLYAQGGRIRAEEGGLMNLGGMEKDYRNEGGFVPIGKAEKADDVPARLSVNEFVFTADAVRNAGGGDIDKGAEVMENMMKNLENGGRVSEESQGNTGAQEMFSVSERIGEVI